MDQIYYDSKSPEFICKPCPSGHYGNVSGLTSSICSGLCSPGYYCPAGSTSPTQYECGGPGFFCPEGSEKPIAAASGRKTVRTIPGVGSTSTSVANTDQLCDYGHYCIGGIQIECPVGKYGDVQGLQTALCSGPCRSGEYCPQGSVNPTICEKGYYCPDGYLRHPCPAGTFGATKGLKDSRCSGLCRPGYYCEQGSTSAVQELCPGGKYGATSGIGDSGCSGPCQAGYYCPPGSLNSTSYPCGSVSNYCPEASSQPLVVDIGYYSSGGSNNFRTEQIKCEEGFFCTFGEKKSCPAGSYGNEKGLGFTGTGKEFIKPSVKPTKAPTNPNPTMNPSVISPTLPTGQPTRQPSGQPTAQPTRQPTSQPSSSPNILNEPELIPTINPTPMPSVYKFDDVYYCSGFCSPGYFCSENSTSATQQPCPGGTFGAVQGLTNNLCSGPCPLGHYCPEGTIIPIKCKAGIFGNSTGLIDEHCNSECWTGGCSDNKCKEGYYCPEGSLTPDQFECGDASVYCPEGSPVPISAPPGYYTIGPFPIENPNTRIDIKLCEAGYFCIDGVKRQCPPGNIVPPLLV
jgi:hypothetical protein